MGKPLTASDHSVLLRLAASLPKGDATRKVVLAGLSKVGREFPNQKRLTEYLKEHPNADKSKHSVRDPKKAPAKGGGILSGDEKAFANKSIATDEDKAAFNEDPAVKGLEENFSWKVIAGENGKVTRGDVARALHVAQQLHKGIDSATDFCKVNKPACKGNLGITRDNMPQIMDKSVKALLSSKKPADRKKGEAAVAAGADPESDVSTQDQWLDSLKKSGVKINDDEIEVGQLIASQAEIKAEKSYSIAKDFLTGKFNDLPDLPILVARDPKTGKTTVIDGHHRYAGLLLADPTRKMKVRVIEAPIQEALEASFDVPGVFRMDLQDEIVDPDKPLDLARKPGSAWQQKGKWYGKSKDKETGGPFKSQEAAKDFASGKGPSKTSALRLAAVLSPGSWERKNLLRYVMQG